MPQFLKAVGKPDHSKNIIFKDGLACQPPLEISF